MADNIRLITFAGSTVTPQDDALVYETAVGQNGLFNGGAVTLKNNNTLHIAAGHGIICGRKFSIVESDITVLLTTGDTQQGRVYIHLDLSNTTDPIQILTETGSALTEPIQQEDVNISNGIYEFNIATFTIDALTISDLVDLKPYVEKVMEKLKELEDADVDTLTTLEQVEASTDNSIPVGAGAVKELNESLEANQFWNTNGVAVGKLDNGSIIYKALSIFQYAENNSSSTFATKEIKHNIPGITKILNYSCSMLSNTSNTMYMFPYVDGSNGSIGTYINSIDNTSVYINNKKNWSSGYTCYLIVYYLKN